MPPDKKGRALIIAGSDSGGGAGIQGDIKTVTALGGYAATAITALTAQNTQGVFGIHAVPKDFVEQQIRRVLEDIGADVIKTGMLHTAGVIEVIARVLDDYPDIPLILDPVLISTSGIALLQPEAVALLKEKLIPRAFLLTPNVPEAEMLASDKWHVASAKDMEQIGKELLSLGCRNVLVKGGHLRGDELTDVLISCHLPPATCHYFTSPRIPTRNTHGTGCALASAIATGIAQGMELKDAVTRAHDYVQKAILTAPGFGKGNGPLNHNHWQS